MKKIKYLILPLLFSLHSQIYATDAGVLGGVGEGSSGLEKLRTGDIHTEDIPKIISYAIDYLMGFAATISIIFVIIGAYKIALGGLEGEKSEGKKTIFYALGGFVLASLSWVIFKIIIDNFA